MMEEAGSPWGVFSQLHILKGFKSCVLKLRIPKGLQSYFSKVRILKELVNSELWVVSSGRKEKKGVGTPPVFCKRVRKLLMPKELAKCSFLRSAEECENRGVSFWLPLQESGRAKQERNRGAGTDPTVRDERREKKMANAETLRAPRPGRGRRQFRREDGDAGRGWKPTFTVYVTATRDNVSRYFSCSNDSNGLRMGRKLIRGMGMGGNLV
jgi:hypothetical protein